MKEFRVEAIAQTEFEEAAVWYEGEREGLGSELIAEVDRVLLRIAHQETFATAPIATVPGGVVRREFVDRFPYVVVFVETWLKRFAPSLLLDTLVIVALVLPQVGAYLRWPLLALYARLSWWLVKRLSARGTL